jgi:uncharacterized membrane protein
MATTNPAARRQIDLPDVTVEPKTTALTGGLVLGLGIGGFIDGILLHQILQWHSMGSAVLPPTTMDAMAQNMRWDGLFHAATLILTLSGVVILWIEGQRGTAPATLRVLAGQMLLGWGVFNLVEGVIDHQVLGLHHVRDLPMHVPAYDWIFLAVGGLAFIGVGWWLSRTGER